MGRSLLGAAPEAPNTQLSFNPSTMTRVLWKEDLKLRKKIHNLLKEDVFRVRYGETVAMERARTMARIARLRSAGMFAPLVNPGKASLERYDAFVDAVALLDHSLEISIGVNVGLFGTTVSRLGSKAQRDYWIPKIVSGEEFGCFALTELGHGSNVRGIETEAVYDAQKQQFILHSPTESSQKYWIGGLAERATWTVAFARLIIAGQYRGIHVFLVQLRDARGNVLPGIQIADCGVKAGLNGVDNGRLWFSRVAVPRTQLLSRKCSVAPDGSYSSSYPTPDALFAATLAALTGGRVGIAYNAVTNTMLGITIAVRYGLVRRAFAPAPGMPETPLLWYSSHQRRLMRPLAAVYVYLPCAQNLREMWRDSAETNHVPRETHALSTGFKALFSWFMMDALQSCREACGGQGYKLENRIAVMKADRDIMLTFEGANDVLMQQVGKMLLTAYAGAAKNGGSFNGDKVFAVLDGCEAQAKGALEFKSMYAVLCLREKALLKTLGKRYADATMREKLGRFEAWNQCLDIAQQASTAHMQRRIFEMHRSHCEQVSTVDKKCARVLEFCGMLWVADVVDSDPAFLRLGCISRAFANFVSDAVPEMCFKLSAVAKELTDAFDFPDHLLAPIAGDYVAHNSRARL